MMRRRKLRLAQVSPPPRRSDGVLVRPKQIAADRLIHPDMSSFGSPVPAARAAVRRQRTENRSNSITTLKEERL